MRIFWWSNAPWARTGYGNQTRIFWPRIQKLGHTVTLGANYGLAGAPLNINEGDQATKVLPLAFTPHGNDIIGQHAEQCKADVVITLYDVWVFNPEVVSKFRWCPLVPVDHEPLGDALKTTLQAAWQPIAYSRFGEAQLKLAGFEPAYVPHAVETNIYKPGSRAEARRHLKLSEKRDDVDFLAVMVAANKGAPSRKSFAEALCAWGEFIKRHPKALLYLHTHAGQQMAGLDLLAILERLEIPDENVMFCDPYWNILGFPDKYMVDVYNAADVLLNPAMGEGFGLPILEAQACGTPVIVGDNTAQSELCFAGWEVAGQPFWTPLGTWQTIPYISCVLDSLEEAYETRGDESLRVKAREGAMQYDADFVTQTYWKPFLDGLAEEITAGACLEMVEL